MQDYTSYFPIDDEDQKRRAWAALAGRDDFGAGTQPSSMNSYNALVPGNVDLANRPYVRNDGGVSTVYSIGDNVDGREMLLPGVSQGGRVMNPDQAEAEFRRTGQNLGQYANPGESDAAGEAIHLDQERHPPRDSLNGRGLRGDWSPPPDPGQLPRPNGDSGLARWGRELSSDAPAPPPQLGAQELERKPSSGNHVNGWALLADALLNKGRGAGGILALGSSGASEAREAELDLKRAQAEHLRRATTGHEAVDPEVLRMRQEALDLRSRGQDFQRDKFTQNVDARKQKLDTSEADRDHYLKWLESKDVDTSELQGVSQATLLKLNPMLAQEYRLAQQIPLNDAAAGRAGAVAEARLPAAKELKRSPGVGQGVGADGEPELTPQMRLQQEKEYRAAADQYNKETGYARGGAQQLKRIQGVVDRYKGDDIPGIGMLDSMMPDALVGLVAGHAEGKYKTRADDQLEISNAKKTLAEMSQRKESGAAGPDAERLRYLVRVGAQTGATAAQFRTGIEAANELMKMELRTFATGKEKAAHESLRNAGLEEYTFGKSEAPPAAAAPSGQRAPETAVPGHRMHDPSLLNKPMAPLGDEVTDDDVLNDLESWRVR